MVPGPIDSMSWLLIMLNGVKCVMLGIPKADTDTRKN